MAGRPRTPTKILDARGAFDKNPNRRRDGEPEVREPIGQMPADFDEFESQAWRDFTEWAPLGVLTRADMPAVESAAVLLAEFRRDRRGFPTAKMGHLIVFLSRFGMTPSDRARLSITKAPEVENPFAALDK